MKKSTRKKAPNPTPLARSVLKSGRFVKVKAVRVRRQGRRMILDVRQ
jgi:hypothetical protein